MTIVTPWGHVWTRGATLGPPKLATNTAQGSAMTIVTQWAPPGATLVPPRGYMHSVAPIHTKLGTNTVQGSAHDNSHTRGHMCPPRVYMCPPGATLGPLEATGKVILQSAPNVPHTPFRGRPCK